MGVANCATQIAFSSVKQISNYIVKKVAEKLEEQFKNERTEFEKKWEDINMFVKYGMLSDDKFRERAIL